MYVEFSEHARKVMQLANQEAQRYNHEHVGTEHILLGIAKEGTGTAAKVLKNFHLNLVTLREELEKVVKPGHAAVKMGKLPRTPRADKAIAYAIEQARRFDLKEVDATHLLIAVLNDRDCVASQVLRNTGREFENFHQGIIEELQMEAAMEHFSESSFPKPPSLADAPARVICRQWDNFKDFSGETDSEGFPQATWGLKFTSALLDKIAEVTGLSIDWSPFMFDQSEDVDFLVSVSRSQAISICYKIDGNQSTIVALAGDWLIASPAGIVVADENNRDRLFREAVEDEARRLGHKISKANQSIQYRNTLERNPGMCQYQWMRVN